MNKPLKIIAAIFALLFIAASFTSCGEDPSVLHYPSRVTAEEAENSAGMRFVISFGELDELMEDMIIRLGRKGIELTEDGEWKILTEGLVDDNGVGYTSYVKQAKDAVLTAAVEDESGKLINVGCGCSSDVLTDERKENFVTLTAALAACVGGYEWKDVDFLKKLTEECLVEKDSALYYDGMSFTRSEDEESTVLILSPSSLETAMEREERIFEVRN